MTRAETSGVREGSSAGPVPVIHNDGRLGGGSLIQTDGLEGAVLGGGKTHRDPRAGPRLEWAATRRPDDGRLGLACNRCG